MLEPFFRIQDYLAERVNAPVRRTLMDEVNWNDRLIGIVGFKGVGKTSFLLRYVRENFSVRERKCLYINLSNLYFHSNSLLEFAQDFVASGGTTLVIDDLQRIPEWGKTLREMYDRCTKLRIIFAGSSVMEYSPESEPVADVMHCYTLKGFSLREFLNLKLNLKLKTYTIREIQNRHERIANEVMEQVRPMEHMKGYLHHGYYPFFLEQRLFTEHLIDAVNHMMEVDILHLHGLEFKHLERIKRLFYSLATGDTGAPNVSQLATDACTSRTTVMNCIKYLTDAGLMSPVYRDGETFPKKPTRMLLDNTNLTYAVLPEKPDTQILIETFFRSALSYHHNVETGDRSSTFIVDGTQRFRLTTEEPKRRATDVIYVRGDIGKGIDQEIPLWMYGFLY